MEYNETINKLTSDGAGFRCQGIIECLENNIKIPQAIEALKKLKNDSVIILGRKVSSYAIAALDILGAEKYSGDDEEIRETIPVLKEYLKKARGGT